jgi:hypothetical protein
LIINNENVQGLKNKARSGMPPDVSELLVIRDKKEIV